MKKYNATTSLRFRYWCEAGRCFVSDYKYTGDLHYFLDSDGVLFPQQSVGILDGRKQLAYEGDFVEFEVNSNMGEWESGGRMSSDLLESMAGQTVSGEIVRDPCVPCNMWIASSNPQGLEMVFPATCISKGFITGNILENKKTPRTVDRKSGRGEPVRFSFHKFRFWNRAISAYATRVWYSGMGDGALVEVDSITPEQCTGIVDKHGVFIFENDILADGDRVFSVSRSPQVPSNLVLVNCEGEVRDLGQIPAREMGLRGRVEI